MKNEKSPKIALAMIVKGTDEEAALLDRCLDNVSPHVDAIFITSTYSDKPNGEIDAVCARHDAKVSYFKWTNDFAKARNFNFSQVPKEYDYILWCDADDMWRGLENLRETVEKYPTADAFGFWYLYEFDEHRQPIVAHKKTMMVKNDGCVSWSGALHEDFIDNRSVTVVFVEGIERMHFTNEDRIQLAKKRNVEVSAEDYERHSDDPRKAWNYANSLMGDGRLEEAKRLFESFIETSGSEEEIYLARLRIADIWHLLGDRKKAVENYQLGIGMRPDYSDGYLQLGYVLMSYGEWKKAEYYLLNGIVKKPPYASIIVFNPRDYDYNPMMALAKVYFNQNRPDMALPMLRGCLEVNPRNDYLKVLIAEMERETSLMEDAVRAISEMEKIGSKDDLRKAIEALDSQTRSHPSICSLWNRNFIRTESTGRDIAYYCGMTEHEWNPEMAKTKGVGGSEEAVMNLSKQWAKQGWNVTVYNSCGTEPMECDGVTYKPFWMFNHRDKWDRLILWRHPKLVDYELNAEKVYVDVHDVVPAGEFGEKRMEKIDRLFVKTKAHRRLYPNIPDEKFAIIPNGQDFDLFDQVIQCPDCNGIGLSNGQGCAKCFKSGILDIEKDQYLLVNTSSPDRSMDVLPKLFKRIKERVPQARLKWAYGFDIFDKSFSTDKKAMAWRDECLKDMEDAGIENLGRLSQKECAKLYLEGNILAYPSEFFEIDCITVKKAQACGCIPITTDFGALDESVQHGIKIHSKLTDDTWGKRFTHGIMDEETQDKWVDAVVEQLQKPIGDRTEMMEWAKKFSWDIISAKWTEIF